MLERTDGKPLQQEIGRKSPRQKSEIEQAAQPVVFRPLEVEIGANAEDGSVTERGLS
jgi:hypothetical protein